ncbi:hypothetical protein [Nitrosopumilus piranensis]|uniref:Uncharacterized protein n=1 Tax=Nitrosopumilus piranensis TaxID=1582439 RepID=A0A0C5BZ84_9ARCH|nr:hypothetical protein [Nitrosopumilus piranensis]AJM92310.1 hypothetical protein NPIRD3C_1098 [Nitrosopumilus piranensis]
MRVDCCRKCGKVQTIKQKCSVCTNPIKFGCEKCKVETDEQIHMKCRLADMNYRPIFSEVA